MESIDNNVPSVKKNLFKLILLAFSGSIIYGLPYFRFYYYDAYVAAYNLTNVQMGALGTAYGILGLLSYLIGGIFADKFSAKKLIVFSLVATGIAGFAHLFFSAFYALIAIYALWGITSLLTFWPALIKMVRKQGSSAEQGRAYGIFEGGRGAVSALHLAAATLIFAQAGKLVGDVAGLRWVIIFYSVAAILAGIFVSITLKDEVEVKSAKASGGFKMSDLIRVVKMPAVWLVIVLLFSNYVFNMSFYYFTPYATEAFKASAVFAAVLTVLAQYCRPIASTGGGFLADKIGRANVLFVGFVCMALSTIVMIVMPKGPGSITLLIAACVVLYLAMYSNYGIFYSLLDEGGVPMEVSGTAIGLVSTLAYLPEALCPLIAGKVLDTYKGVLGYQIYFSGMAVMAVVGAVFCLVWIKIYGKNKKAQAA